MDTIDYYNQNYKSLIDRYDDADVADLHTLYQKYIKKEHFVLDIGFGSGRDLRYLRNITQNLYGIDGSIKFVEHLKRDSFFKDRVALSRLPEIDISAFRIQKFDVIISIAVLMHLDREELLATINQIASIVKQNGIVIISYSTKSRIGDERVFYPLSKDDISKLFASYRFDEIESIVSKDALGRDIDWLTQIFKRRV